MSIFGIRSDLYAIAVSLLFADFGTGMMIPMMPLYITELPSGADLDIVIKSALVFAVFGLFSVASYPVMGRLSDRIDMRKPFVLAGLIGFTVLAVASAMVATFEQLLVIRAAQGIMVGAMAPSVLAMLTHVSTSDNRGRSMGIYSSIRGIGPALGSGAGGLIAGAWGFDYGFYVCAVLGLASIAFVSLFVGETHETSESCESRESRETSSTIVDGRDCDPESEIKLLAYAAFTTMLALMIVATMLPAYKLQLDASVGGLGISIAAHLSARLIFQTPVGILSDRFGRRNILVGGLCGTALLLVGMAHATTAIQLPLMMFAAGVTSAAVTVPALASGADLASPGMVGQQMSLFPMASGIGMVVGPLLAGFAAAYLGFAAPFYICSGLMLVVGVLIARRGGCCGAAG
ncbi:MAG: MFS transporter [Methanosarcinales archaeon]|nr:MFS transporter [Methanosarcinales archaeon]